MNVGHEGRDLGITSLDSLCCRLAKVLAQATSRCTRWVGALFGRRTHKVGNSIVLLDLGRSDALEELLVGGILAHWDGSAMDATLLALMTHNWLEHVRGDDLLQGCTFRAIAFVSAGFVCRLRVLTLSLGRCDALVSTCFLLTVKHLLLS